MIRDFGGKSCGHIVCQRLLSFACASFKLGNRHYIYIMVNHKNLYMSRDPETSQKRNCLRCEKLFLSEHIGNRLCPRCEKRS